MGNEDVLTWTQGALGRIRLNRPRAINALTLPMVSAISRALTGFAADDRIRAIALDGAGERGFSAGADVRTIREEILSGQADPMTFWQREYELNRQLLTFPKPVVSFMDGVVMGGGLGLTGFTTLRLVTETTRVAMPETGIGFFPDVGTMYPLARAPGHIGTHLTMTGLPCGGADAIELNFADAMIAPDSWQQVTNRLADGESAQQVRAVAEISSAPAPLRGSTWITDCYGGTDPVAIRDRLRAHPHPDAKRAAAVIDTRSPLAVAVSLAALRRAAQLPDIHAVLDQDLQIARAMMAHPDFVEGVRALLVDKDGTPAWEHRDLSEVDPELVARMLPHSS